MPFELPQEIASTIEPQYANHASIQRYNSLGEMFKGHAELQDYRGRSIALPNGESKPEELEAWRGEQNMKLKDRGYAISKLGDMAPSSADAYEFKFDGQTPEQVKNDQLLGKYRAIAHEVGLSNKQAQVLAERFGKDILPGMLPAQVAEPEFIQGDGVKALMEKTFKGETTLRLDQYKQAVNILKQTVPDLPDILHDGVIAIDKSHLVSIEDHPSIVKLLSEVGRLLSPDFGGDLQGAAPQAVLDAQKEIDDIHKNPANPMHAGWKAADRKVLDHLEDLYKQTTGGR